MDKPQGHDAEGRAVWVLTLTSIASLMVALDALVVATALTEIGRDFSASIESLEWTVNAYTLTFAVFLMTASVLGDRFGRRHLFAGGMILFVVASAGCASAPSIGWLIAARAMQGVGAATIMPLALAQLGAAFPPERRGFAFGIYSSITALSSVLGPVVGGLITQDLAWQWIFWLNVPIGIVVALLSVTHLRESFGPRAGVDLPGLITVTCGVLGLVWALMRGNPAGWTSMETLSSSAVGALFVALFVAWELRASAPMIPMHLFRSRVFTAGNVAMFLLNATVMGTLFFLAQFQVFVLGQSPLSAGLRILPWGVALALVAPQAGALARRLSEAGVVAFDFVLQAAGFVWMALIVKPDLAYAAMVAPMVAAGSGFAMAIPIVQKAVVSAVAPVEIGKASGTLSTIRQLGGVFGVAIAVAIFALAGGRTTPQSFARGFAAANGVLALFSLLGVVAALWLSREPVGGRVALASQPRRVSAPRSK
jgi:EmrB/QacA subfamily drug resistance transporter